MKINALLAMVMLLFVVGCSKGGSDDTKAGPAVLEIAGNDAMQFDKAELRVKAGQEVKLTLSHTGSMPKAAMGHNWVLLAEGTDFAGFAAAAMNAADNDYIPADQASSVIAHTKVLGGGESDTITFTAPAAGSYDFLCSFPGHSALMKGKLIVE